MSTEAPAAPAPAAPSDVESSSNTPPQAAPTPATTTNQPPAQTPPTQPAAPEGPPQKYDLRVPVEHAPLADQATLAEFEKVSRESGWSNEDAQVALENYLVRVSAKRQEFKQQLASDPEYGGQKLADTERRANLTINHIRPEGHARRTAFLALLHRGEGFFNHPEVQTFLADIGTLIGEDSPGHRTAGSIQDMSQVPTEDVLWPKKK